MNDITTVFGLLCVLVLGFRKDTKEAKRQAKLGSLSLILPHTFFELFCNARDGRRRLPVRLASAV